MRVRIHCVYGESNKIHIEKLLLSSLANQGGRAIDIYLLNYEPGSTVTIEKPPNWVGNFHVLFTPEGPARGFAENHNMLFNKYPVGEHFVIINPDCVAEPLLIEELIKCYEQESNVAIVEARQWPFEQLKEFDPATKETPWASGACCLIDSNFFSEVGGMDESFFMYVEDVDLSWKAWLSGRRVLYQRSAVVKHFTSGFFAPDEEFSSEKLFCLRNHIWLAYNYFGVAGKESALKQIKMIVPQRIFERILWDYETTFIESGRIPRSGNHKMIKILGPNLYHEVFRR